MANGGGGIVSRWRYNATADYDLGSWGLSLTQNFQKRYHDVRFEHHGAAALRGGLRDSSTGRCSTRD